jgi:hypothetical protein
MAGVRLAPPVGQGEEPGRGRSRDRLVGSRHRLMRLSRATGASASNGRVLFLGRSLVAPPFLVSPTRPAQVAHTRKGYENQEISHNIRCLNRHRIIRFRRRADSTSHRECTRWVGAWSGILRPHLPRTRKEPRAFRRVPKRIHRMRLGSGVVRRSLVKGVFRLTTAAEATGRAVASTRIGTIDCTRRRKRGGNRRSQVEGSPFSKATQAAEARLRPSRQDSRRPENLQPPTPVLRPDGNPGQSAPPRGRASMPTGRQEGPALARRKPKPSRPENLDGVALRYP